MADGNDLIEDKLHSMNVEYKKLQEIIKPEFNYQNGLNKCGDNTMNEKQDIFITRLINIVANLFDKKQYSDFKFVLRGGNQVYGHKFILLARNDCWGGEGGLSRTTFFSLTDYSYDASLGVIKWIYTGDVEVNKGQAVLEEMIEISSVYNLDELIERCKTNLVILNDMNRKINQSSDYDDNLHISASGNHVDGKLDYNVISSPISNYDDSSDSLDNNHLNKPSRNSHNQSSNNNETDSDYSCYPKAVLAEENSYKCDICGRVYATNDKLKRHARIHRRKKSLPCEVCQKLFVSRSYLIQHLQTHTGQKLYKCDTCGKSFTSKSHLKTHSLAHEDVSRIKCDFCNKLFSNKSSLKKHIKNHASLKQFKCDVCGKTFRTTQSLERHVHLHTGSKPYLCSECGQGFIQFTQLEVHSRQHSGDRPFPCQFCQKTFASKYVLRQHISIHSSERPYICDVCGLSFNHQSNCRRHMQLHVNAKPFKCDLCGKAYSKKETLKNHKPCNSPIIPLPPPILSYPL